MNHNGQQQLYPVEPTNIFQRPFNLATWIQVPNATQNYPNHHPLHSVSFCIIICCERNFGKWAHVCVHVCLCILYWRTQHLQISLTCTCLYPLRLLHCGLETGPTQIPFHLDVRNILSISFYFFELTYAEFHHALLFALFVVTLITNVPIPLWDLGRWTAFALYTHTHTYTHV